MLEPLGISAAEEDLFRALLRQPRATTAEVAATAGVSTRTARRLLDSLEERGLVVRVVGSPTRYVPSFPDLALEGLILRRQEELEQVREVARQLAAEFRQALAGHPAAVVEIISGREAVSHHTAQLQRSATESLLMTDRPPYAEAGITTYNREEVELLARGVHVRCIYHRPTIELPDHLAQIESYLAAGEHARLMPNVPIKLLIVDRRRAMVPISQDQEVYDAAILVHESPLLDALVLCFEAMWDRAIPMRVTIPGELVEDDGVEARPGAQDRQLLMLLAAGLKDEAVARQLGLSARTVVRRVDRLMRELGADTRFQAGLQVVRRGWL